MGGDFKTGLRIVCFRRPRKVRWWIRKIMNDNPLCRISAPGQKTGRKRSREADRWEVAARLRCGGSCGGLLLDVEPGGEPGFVSRRGVAVERARRGDFIQKLIQATELLLSGLDGSVQERLAVFLNRGAVTVPAPTVAGAAFEVLADTFTGT